MLGRFFAWVIAAIVLLLASGYAMIFGVFGGFAGVGLHVHIMQGIGIVMMLLVLPPLFRAVAALPRGAWRAGTCPTAARQLDQIRTIVTVNLVLGLVTVAVGSSGRYWG